MIHSVAEWMTVEMWILVGVVLVILAGLVIFLDKKSKKKEPERS